LRYDSVSRTNVSDRADFIAGPNGLPYLQTAKYYSGASTLLKTVDFTYTGTLPTTIKTTLNDTGQSSQVFLQYFNNYRNFISQEQETDFTGTIVRTTKTAYTGGSFLKPSSINVYTGSGTGSPVASTIYTYDEYSANYCKNGVSMLANFAGAYGHDDTNFGTSDTIRGNVTTIQRLISGTTYATSHMCYDTLGNVTQVVDPKGNPTSYDYSENWADTSCIPAGTVTHAFPKTITDALGHRTNTTRYSCNVRSSAVADENDIVASRSGTTYTYNWANRPLCVNRSDGGQTCSAYFPTAQPPYSTQTTLLTATVSKATEAIMDGYGRATQTQLTSDPEGVDYKDTTYDLLGHTTSVSNPYRATSDPTYGVTHDYYDALGRPTSVVKPDGSAVTTSYSGNCTTVTDESLKVRKACVDGLGRVTKVLEDPSGLNYETDYAYDVLDNLTCVVQKGTDTTAFTTCASAPASWRPRSFVYDSLSRLTSATNPESGIHVQNSYNSRLQPLQVFRTTGATLSPTQLAMTTCPGITGTIMHLVYGFGAGTNDNGDVVSMANCRDTNRTQNFTYDSLNRIQNAYTNGPNWGETYTIDAWGNMTAIGSYQGKPHEGLSTSALTNNQLVGFSYDAAGNLTQNGATTYTYDGENRLANTSGWVYTYDGDGKRIKKCASSCTTGTLYWTGIGSDTLSESDLSGNMQEEYIYFSGGRVARRDVSTNSVHYFFTNHLGSTSVITNSTGSIPPDEDLDYFPYGGVASGTPSDHYEFTGKERDSESGLDNFGKRYNASTMGRFMTPDAFYKDSHVGDPQSWNEYAYARNNPLRYVDPAGEAAVPSNCRMVGDQAAAQCDVTLCC
jgi:RHS repeat-associated protein